MNMSFNTPTEILTAIGFTSKYLKELFPLDCMTSVTDRETFIAYYPGEIIDVGARVGQPIPSADVIHKAIETGKKIVAEVPKEAYGFAFKGIIMPIRDNSGEVIGTFNVGIDLSTQNNMMEIVENLAASFEQVSASSQELASSAQELNNIQNELLVLAQEAKESLNRTNQILKLIDDVASQTKMLGLNAAIEAARAGEAGRGFTVVAQEIRKLSDNTTRSTSEITEVLNSIKANMEQIVENIQKAEDIGNSQAAASEEISASITENATVAEKLTHIARLF
jgi:predicted transcriptional regulator YheO